MDQSHLDKMEQPGFSNRTAKSDPFKRNQDGTVPADAIVPADESHVASAKAQHAKHDAAPENKAEPKA